MVGRARVTIRFSVGRIFAAPLCHVLVVVLLFVMSPLSALAQDQKGCEGVRYAKHSPAEYSLERLKERVAKDPSDVDALIHLGIHLEEQSQFTQAFALYERAIQIGPTCYLGYYFAGLVGDRISRDTASEAQSNISKAVSLNPSLRDDANVQGFMKRHPRAIGGTPPIDKEPPSEARHILAAASPFSIGLAVGILLAAIFFCLARFVRAAPKGS